MFLDAFHPEKVRRRARRKNQIIVMDFAVVGYNNVALLVDAARLRHEQIDVFVVAEERTHRVGDFARLQNRSRHLIQQRLEQVEIVTIDKRNLDVLLGEQLTDFDTAEAAAHDYDMGLAINHVGKPPNAVKILT